jgi:hypothetical protein
VNSSGGRRRFAALLGVLAVSAGTSGAVAQPPSRAGKAKSTVTISSRVPAFNGTVKSGSASCVSGRRVELFRRSGGGGANRLGSDRTNSGGRWQVGVDPLQAGAYYAKVKPKSGGSVACRGARSEIVVVD